jgi:hypothetical protein
MMPLKSPQVEKALVPYQEHPLVIFKPEMPLPSQDLQKKSQQIVLPSQIKQRLITVARAVRTISFGARTLFVGITGALVFYEKFKADDAPEIVKDFCYQEAGRRNFKIKIDKGGPTSFSTMFNTLYVPNGSLFSEESLQETLIKESLLKRKQKKYLDEHLWHKQKQALQSQILQQEECIKRSPTPFYIWELEQEQEVLTLRDLTKKLYKLDKQPTKKIINEQEMQVVKARMNLFKGILDHEMGHLNHYDRYRLPIMLGVSMLGMEYFWSTIRPRLESNFKLSDSLGSGTVKKAALMGGHWIIKLVAPTVLYTGAFFAARQLAKKTIEAQADANVRDDLGVLTEVEQYFRKRAVKDEEWNSDAPVMKAMFQFFDPHPSDKRRANYFAHRVEELKKKDSASPCM